MFNPLATIGKQWSLGMKFQIAKIGEISMARPMKAVQKEPIGYQSVTVRLPQTIIEALNKLDKGKRAEFIRNAITTQLKANKA